MISNIKKIPEFKLELIPFDKDAKGMKPFRWASCHVGHRGKIGGLPDFLQHNDWPACNICKNKMIFYAQLDSLNDEFVIADCGMIYTFICFDCNTVSSIIQSG